MSLPALLETAVRLLRSPLVLRVEFLGTKIRAHLPKEYFLDIYYNATLGKYGYTVIKHNRRVIGWDNAEHHRRIRTHPHHFHNLEGDVTESPMKGDPIKDLDTILQQTQKTLKL